MLQYQVGVFCAFLSVVLCSEDWKFPPGFKFGAASASYQVEGGWNASDKGENMWDRFIHANSEAISDLSNGDVACDSYHKWKRDIQITKELGLHFYRFSISWARVFPTGFTNYISEDGKQYYNKLIDGLLAAGVEPLVTIYHSELPQSLQDLGGWANPLIIDWFRDYARAVYSLYGNRVHYWLTLNEPLINCDVAYNTGGLAPGIVSPDLATYLCSKNMLLAHAAAYRVYDEEFRAEYHGEVSFSNQLIWFEPWTEQDVDIAELANQNLAGRYSHPVYSKEGGWPPGIMEIIVKNSERNGYSKSVFTDFTQEEIEYLKGTFDYYAVNYYTSRIIRNAEPGEVLKPWALGDAPELNAITSHRPEWGTTAAYWFYQYAPGLRRLLVWLKKNYGDIKFLITENGYPSVGGLNDQDRINYYESHLKQVWLAIKEDGINVTHYTAWTMLDNFEWGDGYRVKFGLYEVDFNDPNRTRTPRASAHYYASIIKNHSLNIPNTNIHNITSRLYTQMDRQR